jgi:hypothetical protein
MDGVAKTAPAAVHLGVLTLLTALAACGDRTTVAPPVAIRDSAGIRIVENAAPAWERGREWSVAVRPAVRIGQAEGAPEYAFDGVRGAARLPDGTIVVADRGSSQLRFYDPSGRFLRATGRRGRGPGEFSQIMGMIRLPGDSLLVNDAFDRALVYDPDGRFVRIVPLRGDGDVPFSQLLGRFSDGAFLVRSNLLLPPGMYRDTSPVLRLRPDGALQDTLGFFPAIPMAGRGITWQPVVFGPRPVFATTDARLYFARSDRPEARQYSAAGRLERLIRWPWTPVPVTDAQREEYRTRQVDLPGERGRPVPAELREQRRRVAEGATFAERFPALSRLLVDRAGNLWVQDFSVSEVMQRGGSQPIESEPSPWRVFDPEGRWLGIVVLPARFQVLEIGDDYLLGIFRDGDGVESVQMFPLEKPA